MRCATSHPFASQSCNVTFVSDEEDLLTSADPRGKVLAAVGLLGPFGFSEDRRVHLAAETVLDPVQGLHDLAE